MVFFCWLVKTNRVQGKNLPVRPCVRNWTSALCRVNPGPSRRALDRRAGNAAGTALMHRFSFPLKGVDAQAFTAGERTSASF